MNNEQLKAYIGVSHYVQQQADLNVPDTDATNVAYVKGYDRVNNDINTAVENTKNELNESISVLESKIESCETISNEAKTLIVDAIKNSPCDKVFEGDLIISYEHTNNWLDHEKFEEYIATKEGQLVVKNAVDTYKNNVPTENLVKFSYNEETGLFETLGKYSTLDLSAFIKETPETRDSISLGYAEGSAIDVAYSYLKSRNEWLVGKVFVTAICGVYYINVIIGESIEDVVSVTYTCKEDIQDLKAKISKLFIQRSNNKIITSNYEKKFFDTIANNKLTLTIPYELFDNNSIVEFDCYFDVVLNENEFSVEFNTPENTIIDEYHFTELNTYSALQTNPKLKFTKIGNITNYTAELKCLLTKVDAGVISRAKMIIMPTTNMS